MVQGPDANAVAAEAQRLRIAEKWAHLCRSQYARQFDQGRADRVRGAACRSAAGAYLEGWYSVAGGQVRSDA